MAEQQSGAQGALSMLFGTPFMSWQWPDSDELNRELTGLILEREASDPQGRGIRSNAGGWQSRGNLITWSEPCIQALKERYEAMVFNLLGQIVRKDGSERRFQLLTDAWANVCRRGDYNVVHTHPNAMWSLVYYVSAGEPDPSVRYGGALELLDPRESANYIQVQHTILDARSFIENIPGRMILFPSWVKHMVHPFVGDGVRISIAANVNVVETNPVKP
ncbi:MAG: 2OG-Fe(II) oxygenase family protein [Gammaproteobacteria bacterium]|nr:2OG-Fe(II) oxygenase family protein [Gammaproteobacteria bacterium]MDH4254070.1 2OG-Fe(II) oxygenase family protein [Gammaproteobacteria bacterium]MDH5310488.1 2OG-Fe(II) oxygenase family protein [Gammaproteobacteria bacterium]